MAHPVRGLSLVRMKTHCQSELPPHRHSQCQGRRKNNMVKDKGEGPKPIWKMKGLGSFLGVHEMSLEGWVARQTREKDAYSPEHKGDRTLQQEGRRGREATNAGKVERNRCKGLVYRTKTEPTRCPPPLRRALQPKQEEMASQNPRLSLKKRKGQKCKCTE